MAVYKQNNSQFWSYRFMWGGEVIRKSTGQKCKRAAVRIELEAKKLLRAVSDPGYLSGILAQTTCGWCGAALAVEEVQLSGFSALLFCDEDCVCEFKKGLICKGEKLKELRELKKDVRSLRRLSRHPSELEALRLLRRELRPTKTSQI